MGSTITYPFTKFRFRMIVGEFTAGFSEISGGDATTDVIEYRAGSYKNNSTIKSGGLTRYSNITVKWGMTEDKQLYAWFSNTVGGETAIDGKALDRKDITIELLGDDAETVQASWQIKNAWPCKYAALDFNANSSEFAFETMELAFEVITRI